MRLTLASREGREIEFGQLSAGSPLFRVRLRPLGGPSSPEGRQVALSTQQLADLSTPEAFDDACREADRGDVLSKVRACSDIERQLAWIQEDAAMGFERIYLHNVARAHQDRFIDLCGRRLLPALAAVAARTD